jgi:hypothetical protein
VRKWPVGRKKKTAFQAVICVSEGWKGKWDKSRTREKTIIYVGLTPFSLPSLPFSYHLIEKIMGITLPRGQNRAVSKMEGGRQFRSFPPFL